MILNQPAYDTPASIVHQTDAAVKVIVLFAFSVALFAVQSWQALILGFAFSLACAYASGIPAGRYNKLLIPVYVLMGVAVLLNAAPHIASALAGQGQVAQTAAQEAAQSAAIQGAANISAQAVAVGTQIASATASATPALATLASILIAIEPVLKMTLRIIALSLASFVVSLTTTSSQFSHALARLLSPLRHPLARLNIAVDDIVVTLYLALSFIPQAFAQAGAIKGALTSRGAFGTQAKPRANMRAAGALSIALFVSLFRRADTLALAMDARCYGQTPHRTSLAQTRPSGAERVFACVFLALCVMAISGGALGVL